jgi:hypothetical protein
MSWTLDREKAIWFANRWARIYGSPRLYQTRVDPSEVLGYVVARSESEIVIDPSGLPALQGLRL